MSLRLSTGSPLRLLGAHVRRRAQDHAAAVVMRRASSCVGDDGAARRSSGRAAVRAPWRGRNRAPSPCRRARTLMLAGFRSRWMMPCSCAASSASAIWRAIGSASSSGSGPLRRCARRASALRPAPAPARDAAVDVLDAVDRGDVRMIERGEHLRFALEAREAVGIVGDRGGSTLIATSRPSLVSARGTPRPCRLRRARTRMFGNQPEARAGRERREKASSVDPAIGAGAPSNFRYFPSARPSA